MFSVEFVDFCEVYVMGLGFALAGLVVWIVGLILGDGGGGR